ncbi:PIG-L deacetylase family protein [Variovorax ginsengisoli]|jgi:LmbE family N-acetylglucosaminyl deacetylase|uniref:PIG-L deacetylase family protein n=1 Tax=Variovorax ginsengisoli TaxID=363844 RepID=A0ABT8S2X1_9BURK|nr:PIG-L deacetylase family protein [Variovorax ginsengisoli]MDN8613678.1 PIG-L deacetylase family protein [Variovorax ginsengisoli]MDO1532848.1 PIG-L deacetylase family protein [Variovorax ginsengisoli]
MEVVEKEGDRVIHGDGTTEDEWHAWSGLRQMRTSFVETLVPAGGRAVVVAPHPDDEVLAVGGLLAQLARLGSAIRVIAVTDGTASHRGSRDWPVERLVRERPGESREALHRLGVDIEPIRLGLPDGGLRGLETLLADRLLTLFDRQDVVFTTWRGDGHPDHEATGHACAFAAARTGAKLVEVPVWAWHWAAPGDKRLPWLRARRLDLDAQACRRKQSAVRAFASQIEADASTGRPPILRPTTLARAARPFEVFFT